MDFIVAGLGNPGSRYTFTRHNAGFLALDYYSQKHGFAIKNAKHHSFCAKITLTLSNKPFDLLFLKPQTFMNNSGEAVADAARFYKVPPRRTLIIYDDVALPPGKLRIRKNGSDGGHNGIKSIIYHLKSEDFPRIKIGVGARPPQWDLADWVTSNFPDGEKQIMFDAFARTADALDAFLTEGSEAAMNRFNADIPPTLPS